MRIYESKSKLVPFFLISNTNLLGQLLFQLGFYLQILQFPLFYKTALWKVNAYHEYIYHVGKHQQDFRLSGHESVNSRRG